MAYATVEIKEEEFSWDLEKWGCAGFIQHSLDTMGCEGGFNSFAFVCREGEKQVGLISGKIFYKALHIRHLIIERPLRRKGVGTELMNRAMKKGREVGCHFVYLETLSFQALGFYKKLGFELEFTRSGYDRDVSMHHLRKDL